MENIQEAIIKLAVEKIYGSLIPAGHGYQITRYRFDDFLSKASIELNATLRGPKRNNIVRIHDLLVNDKRFKVDKGQGNLSPLSRNTWFYAVK